MRTVEAQAYEDESHPDGGRVVILLRDVSDAPARAFRIKPVDAAGDTGAAWPAGDLQLIESRATDAGVELVVGHEFNGREHLTPGTAVEIELPDAALRAEFLWPAVGQGQRRRRRHLVIANQRRQPLAVADDDRDSPAPTQPAQTAEIHTLPVKANAPSRAAVMPFSDNGTTAMSQSNSILGKLDALDAIADLGAAAAAAAPAETPLAVKPKMPPQPSLVQPSNESVIALFSELKQDIEALKREQRIAALPPQEQQLYGALADLRHEIESLKREQTMHHAPSQEQQLYGVLAELRRDISALKHEQAHPHHGFPAAGEQQLYGMLAELRRDISSLKHEQAHQPHPPGEQQLYGLLAELRRDIEVLRHDTAAPQIPAHERELYGMLNQLRREIHDLHDLKQHQYEPNEGREAIAAAYGARGAIPHTQPAPINVEWWSKGSFARSFVVSYLPVLLAAVALTYAMTKQPRAPEPTIAIATPAAAPGPVSPAPARAMLRDDATPLFESLAAGAVSPKGVGVAGVDPQQALARAQAALAAGGARDAEEGGFWLKRYLAMTQGDRRTARALTQLGSVYAESAANGTADYTGARRVWEIASALGDPAAMCLLGRLFEGGMAVPASKPMALQWYERARDAGGCDGLEASIARVR